MDKSTNNEHIRTKIDPLMDTLKINQPSILLVNPSNIETQWRPPSCGGTPPGRGPGPWGRCGGGPRGRPEDDGSQGCRRRGRTGGWGKDGALESTQIYLVYLRNDRKFYFVLV